MAPRERLLRRQIGDGRKVTARILASQSDVRPQQFQDSLGYFVPVRGRDVAGKDKIRDAARQDAGVVAGANDLILVHLVTVSRLLKG